MKKIIICIAILLLSSCAKSPVDKDKTNNYNFEIELLFEYDGIKVYRFYDNWTAHYFTSNGHCISTKYKQVGKTIYRYDETICMARLEGATAPENYSPEPARGANGPAEPKDYYGGS